MKEKILIVEDEATTRSLLVKLLEDAGYQVMQAADGVAGYQIAKATKPDLILSDILMPEMDGNELMKRLKKSEFGKDILFVVLSARTQMQDYFEMMKADDFIKKPFDGSDVLARIDKVLEAVRRQREDDANKDQEQTKKKIMILDNERTEYEKFKKVLMDNHFEVDGAAALDDCLELALSFRPDLIALRFLIDNINGDKMIKTLKEISAVRNVPYVVYSRKTRGWEEKKVLSAGGACFIGEVDETKLLEAVKSALTPAN